MRARKEATLTYLNAKRACLRWLDISSSENITSAIEFALDFRHLKELNLLDSSVCHEDLSRILRTLRELETLSFPLEHYGSFEEGRLEGLGHSSCLKKLYIDAHVNYVSFRIIVELMNDCHVIETVHVHLTHDGRIPTETEVPTLDAARWETLNTFKLTHMIHIGKEHRELLTKIFAHRFWEERDGWINYSRPYYIYERGLHNRKLFGSDEHDVDLSGQSDVRQYQELYLDAFMLSSGPPNSLKVEGFGWTGRQDLLRYLSPQLTELDLSGYHRANLDSRERWEETRLSVIASLPCLTLLAVSACFVVPTSSSSLAGSEIGVEPHKGFLRKLGEALEGLKLKTLYLDRTCGAGYCQDCTTRFSNANIVRLDGLKHLRELNVIRLFLESSAFESLSNRNLRTARLELDCLANFLGFSDFVQRCPNLENVKLGGLYNCWPTLTVGGAYSKRIAKDLQAREHHLREQCSFQMLKESLTQIKKLEQLCLMGVCERASTQVAILGLISRLSQDLQILHLHGFECSSEDEIVSAVEEVSRIRNKCIFLTLRSDLSMGSPFEIKGRSLCHSRSFAGSVKPMNWEVE